MIKFTYVMRLRIILFRTEKHIYLSLSAVTFAGEDFSFYSVIFLLYERT